jgi:hypothetical protein
MWCAQAPSDGGASGESGADPLQVRTIETALAEVSLRRRRGFWSAGEALERQCALTRFAVLAAVATLPLVAHSEAARWAGLAAFADSVRPLECWWLATDWGGLSWVIGSTFSSFYILVMRKWDRSLWEVEPGQSFPTQSYRSTALASLMLLVIPVVISRVMSSSDDLWPLLFGFSASFTMFTVPTSLAAVSEKGFSTAALADAGVMVTRSVIACVFGFLLIVYWGSAIHLHGPAGTALTST